MPSLAVGGYMPRPYSTHPDLRRLLSRRQMVRAAAAAVAGLMGLFAVCNRPGEPGHRGDDWSRFDAHAFDVADVIDGDTVDLRTPAGQTRVRLLGIDAPEMNYERGQPDHWAREATNAAKKAFAGQPVYVRLDTGPTRDKHGRLLAYLYLGPDDPVSVNQRLVRDGNAYAHRFFAHTQRIRFESDETDARTHHRGLWKDVTESQMPGWRRDWLAERRGRRGGIE